MKKSFLSLPLLSAALWVTSPDAHAIKLVSDTNPNAGYFPEISGTVRPMAEWETSTGLYRFQVRNARLTVGGNIAPANLEYFYQMDFCDMGKMKVLDFFGKVRVFNGFKVQAGQFRIPFGVEPFRAAHQYYFSNCSYLGKEIANNRRVGVAVDYKIPATDLSLEAGVFSPYSIADHNRWSKKLTFASKLSYKIQNTTLTTGFQTLCPDLVRYNMADACVQWKSGRWTAVAEYMYQHYTRKAHKPAHSYMVFGDYRMPVKAGIFNWLSFQARFDGMTDHSSAISDQSGYIFTDDPARNRVTVGSTISYVAKNGMSFDLRLDYDKCFYHKGVVAPVGEGDKVVTELVFHF